MSSFSSLNKVMLLGRLGRDPEVKTTNGGVSVCNFSLATSESIKKGDSWEDKTTWHNIVVFGKLAENCARFCKKGSQVFIEGRLQTRSYQGKDGSEKHVTETVANSVKFLDSKNEAKPAQPKAPVVDLEDDSDLGDLPF